MRFVRKHNQQNIVKDDKFIQRKDNVDLMEPEIFENVMRFNINTENFQLLLAEGDKYNAGEIIETANYITIVTKDGRGFNCIKWADVINYEFEV